jgi:hypothetical protein
MVKVTLRLAVFHQSLCLGVKPIETHDQTFLSPQLNPCGNGLYACLQLLYLALATLLLRIRCCKMCLSVRYLATDVLPLLVTRWLERVYRAVD